MLWNNSSIVPDIRILSMIVFFSFPVASAVAGQSCPEHSNTTLRFVAVFDGDPRELAELQPDGHSNNSGYYLVGEVYKQGRNLYLQCEYRNNSTETIRLSKRISRCSYSFHKDASLEFICR